MMSSKKGKKTTAGGPTSSPKTPPTSVTPDPMDEGMMTPVSLDQTEDELMGYEASSLEGDATHREQDFGYEVIDQASEAGRASAGGGAVRRSPQHLGQIPAAFAKDIQQSWDDQQRREVKESDEDGDRLDGLQYRGTPERKVPSRSKRKGGSGRTSQEPRTPDPSAAPPLPPKKPGGKRANVADAPVGAAASGYDDYMEEDEDEAEVLPVKV